MDPDDQSNIPQNKYPIRVQVVGTNGQQVTDFGSSSVAPTSNATFANVASSASAVTLKTANDNRKTVLVFNDSTSVLYVAEFPTSVATVSAVNHSYQIAPGSLAVISTEYTGVVQGVWASVNGSARVTEH